MGGGNGDAEKWTDVVTVLQRLALCQTGRPPLDDPSHCNPVSLKHLNFPLQDEVKFPKWHFLCFHKVNRLACSLSKDFKRYAHKTPELSLGAAFRDVPGQVERVAQGTLRTFPTIEIVASSAEATRARTQVCTPRVPLMLPHDFWFLLPQQVQEYKPLGKFSGQVPLLVTCDEI